MVPLIFLYLDYRHYLKDAFESLKEADASFSYRKFARLAGSSSPNLLQLIHSRKLNISSAQVSALASAFELSSKEEKYFETIVAFDHAKTHTEKDKFFQRILLTRENFSIKTIEKKQYEYLSHWYNPVIRELVVNPEYPDDPAWVAERIVPAITAGKVKKGINLLIALDLIRKNPGNNRWFQTDNIISTPSQVMSMAVVKYHHDIIQLAHEAVERFAPKDRDIRSITLGISRKQYNELKKRMETIWKEVLSYGDTTEDIDQVIQVNLQLFPLSKRKGKKK